MDTQEITDPDPQKDVGNSRQNPADQSENRPAQAQGEVDQSSQQGDTGRPPARQQQQGEVEKQEPEQVGDMPHPPGDRRYSGNRHEGDSNRKKK